MTRTNIVMELLRSAIALGVCVWAIGINDRAYKMTTDMQQCAAELAVAQDNRLTALADQLECKTVLEQAAEVMSVMRDRLKACYAGEFK